jgi:transposase
VQYQEELPPARPLVTRLEVRVGRCRVCGRQVQPRHPAQTSDALGAAGAQLGPRAVALAAWLSKGLGVPAGKIAALLGQLGIAVTPGGVVQAVARAARRVQPPTRRWPRACGPVPWSRPMRPAGGSVAQERGCGPSPARR